MKKTTFTFSILARLLLGTCLLATHAPAQVEDVDVSRETPTSFFKLGDYQWPLYAIIADVQNPSGCFPASDRISHLTPDEARLAFFDYAKERLVSSELLDACFSKTYFGDFDALEKTNAPIAVEDIMTSPYVSGHISSFICEGTVDGLTRPPVGLREAMSKWDSRIPLLDPETVQNAFYLFGPMLDVLFENYVYGAYSFFRFAHNCQTQPEIGERYPHILPQLEEKKTLFAPLYGALVSVNAIEERLSFGDAKEKDPSLFQEAIERLKPQLNQTIQEVFSHKYFGVSKAHEARRDFFLSHDVFFLTDKIMRDIHSTAKRILDLSGPGDILVSFGNSPFFVGRALERLVAESVSASSSAASSATSSSSSSSSASSSVSQARQIISFPFSGKPGPQSAWRTAHLQNRLKAAGLSSENPALETQKVFFLDVVGGGVGVSFVIEEMMRDFKRSGKALPDLNIITLNKVGDPEYPIMEEIITSHSGDKLVLSFPDKKAPRFHVDAHVVHLEGHTKSLGNDSAPRMVPRYLAHYWVPEYDTLLTAPLAEHAQTLQDCFDTKFEEILRQESQSPTP